MWSDIRKENIKKWTSAAVLLPGNKRRLNARKIFENVRIIGKSEENTDREVAFPPCYRMHAEAQRVNGRKMDWKILLRHRSRPSCRPSHESLYRSENWYFFSLFRSVEMTDCAKGKKIPWIRCEWRWRIRIFRAEIKTKWHGTRCSRCCSRPDSQWSFPQWFSDFFSFFIYFLVYRIAFVSPLIQSEKNYVIHLENVEKMNKICSCTLYAIAICLFECIVQWMYAKVNWNSIQFVSKDVRKIGGYWIPVPTW